MLGMRQHVLDGTALSDMACVHDDKSIGYVPGTRDVMRDVEERDPQLSTQRRHEVEHADAMRAAGVSVDHRQFGSLVHGFANFFPLGGGSATATTEMISALRAHLARA